VSLQLAEALRGLEHGGVGPAQRPGVMVTQPSIPISAHRFGR
jgi:hypothetical protein